MPSKLKSTVNKMARPIRGAIKLRPTQVHRTKKDYERKRNKIELKNITKTAS